MLFKANQPFPQIEEKLWKGRFWSPSYLLATSGQVTLEC